MTTPSRNPANDDTLIGVLNQVIKKQLQKTDDMLPARVVSYSRSKNRATVQPIITMVTTEGAMVSRAQIASVPVLQLGGGGALLSFNLQPGDLGWIKANDRDISLFLQSYTESKPNTKRLHTFSDGVFIPDVMTGFVINGEDDANAVLQSIDGTQRFSVAPDYVKMSSGDNSVLVNATTVTATVGTTTLVVTGSGITLTVGGTTMTLGGAGVSSSGAWVHTGTMQNNGVNVGSTHQHSGVTTGGGNTGAPI